MQTALRYSDVATLRWSDLSCMREGYVLHKKIVKTGKTVEVFLNETAVTILRHKNEQQRLKHDKLRGNRLVFHDLMAYSTICNDLDDTRLALRAGDGEKLPAPSLQLFAPELQLALQRNAAALRLDDPRMRERNPRRHHREVKVALPESVPRVVRQDDGLNPLRLQERLGRLAAAAVA